MKVAKVCDIIYLSVIPIMPNDTFQLLLCNSNNTKNVNIR